MTLLKKEISNKSHHNSFKIIRKHPPKNELKQWSIQSPYWRTELMKILKDTLENNRIKIKKLITLFQVICGFNINLIRFWSYYDKRKKNLKLLWNPSKPRRAKSILNREQNFGHDTWQIKLNKETSTEYQWVKLKFQSDIS